MSATIAQPKKVWTEAELMSLPETGYDYELIDGELLLTPKEGFWHAQMCARLRHALTTYTVERGGGIVVGGNTGFWMVNGNCLSLDISFITKERVGRAKDRMRNFFPGAPDLTIEVLVRDTSPREIDQRLRDFFSSGTQIAWVILGHEQFAQICHSTIQRELLGPGGSLDGEHLLPGFKYPLADLFKEWDWD